MNNIKGYRDLSEQEVALINQIKAVADSVESLVVEVRNNSAVDPRWVSIAQTSLQQGFMALVRSVAKPNGF